jgi:hypothetical protein
MFLLRSMDAFFQAVTAKVNTRWKVGNTCVRHATRGLRISEIPDSDFTNSRTAVSVTPGQWWDDWSLLCCHSSSVMISGFSVWVNPGFSLFRRMAKVGSPRPAAGSGG